MSDEHASNDGAEPPYHKMINAFVNPLAFHEVDRPWTKQGDSIPSPEAILRFLCPPDMESDTDSIAWRYREISVEKSRIYAVPREPNYLNRMVWPLRAAKGSYATGNYLATIALSGTVMEMITILSFQLNAVRGRPEYWTEERQRRLFGRTFERLGQEQRVKVLRGLDIIDDELVETFDLVREKRRKHLHFYDTPPDAADDARECYLATVEAMVEMLGPKTVGDHATFNPKLLDYLEEQGIVVPIDSGVASE